MVALRFALAVGLLSGHVSANSLGSSSSAASSQAHTPIVSCRTKLGTNSLASVPTTTVTRRIHDPSPVVVLSTTRDTVTSTPVLIVTGTEYETSTVTSTTDAVTDTFSTTSTEFDTATVTITPDPDTSTVFATVSTTITQTSTIATSPGFIPIVDTLPTGTANKRSLVEEDCSPGLDDYEYPEEVVCHEKIILKTTTVSTVTGSPLTMTAAASTSTVMITNTITTSSVVVPSDVSTTLSYSTTSTITETSTAPAETSIVTETTTVTGATTTTSAYAACATDNIAGSPLSSEFGSFAGKYVYSLEFTHIPGESITVGNTASVYDCCASCLESSTCAMSYYYSTSSVTYCYLIHTTTCSVGSTYGTAGLSNSQGYAQLFNGNCGTIKGQFTG
ncbi:hypothetical protein N7523_002654 [Penicillium sp. IBT 18751x]|nr:hypothetical protein N7523_002654 [Penicillium sp. IBT 18751x]